MFNSTITRFVICLAFTCLIDTQLPPFKSQILNYCSVVVVVFHHNILTYYDHLEIEQVILSCK